ncbi:MAG: methyl-accepting chemotaxis protein, partial [Treponema sp.]|nr:methyl-accepting chemotaxis protein [Treponema sp.]
MISLADRIRLEERDGEVIINYFRLALAVIYVSGMGFVSFMEYQSRHAALPGRAYAGPVLFLLEALALLFYLRNKKLLHPFLKYINVIIDMSILSLCLFVSATYPEILMPVSFMGVQSLFYILQIVLGAFRYHARCAVFSGIFTAVLFVTVMFLKTEVIDVPYTAIVGDQRLPVSFPAYQALFWCMAYILAGVITGIASKRHHAMLNTMLKLEAAAAEAASKTVAQTREIAKTIQESTNEIFHSSKEIFTTANNQAASVEEIVSTMNETAQIAADIADKTGSVATIATRMEEDINHGFSVLESNVTKMGDIKEKNDGVISGIVALGNKISKIRDIVKTINTITDNTKVIAFNAALEAASAGDKGKRFA